MANFIDVVKFIPVAQGSNTVIIPYDDRDIHDVNKYLPDELYELRGRECDDFEMPPRVFSVVQKFDELAGVIVDGVVMKQVDGPDSSNYALTRLDCEFMNISYEPGLQIFSQGMNFTHFDPTPEEEKVPIIRDITFYFKEFLGCYDQYLKGTLGTRANSGSIANLIQQYNISRKYRNEDVIEYFTKDGNSFVVYKRGDDISKIMLNDTIEINEANEWLVRLTLSDKYVNRIIDVLGYTTPSEPTKFDGVIIRLNGFKLHKHNYIYNCLKTSRDNVMSRIIDQDIFAKTIIIKYKNTNVPFKLDFINDPIECRNMIGLENHEFANILDVTDSAIYIIVKFNELITADKVNDLVKNNFDYNMLRKGSNRAPWEFFGKLFDVQMNVKSFTGDLIEI